MDAVTADLAPKFKDWLDELNTVAAKRLYADAESMWQATGSDAWEGYYEDGLSPADALTEDERNGV